MFLAVTRVATPLLATLLVAAGCGTSSETAPAEAQTTTVVATTTKEKTAEEIRYDKWSSAYQAIDGPKQARELSRAYDYQAGACEVLRNGGTEGSDLHPSKSPAQYLRDSWGVGNDGPGTDTKAEVLEKAVIPNLCPDQTLVIAEAKAGAFERQLPTAFGNGKFLVGENIQPGTYTISEKVSDCYWERSDSQVNIIDNNFISISPSVTVTILESDAGFTSQTCGRWKLDGA